MKNAIKKLINGIIDLFSIPFSLLFSFIKNADSILAFTVRLILLIILSFLIVYTIVAKPYRMLLSGFYFEKYKNAGSITSILDENKNILDNVAYLKKIGAICKKNKDGKFYNCYYNENRIYKKYKWSVFLRYNDKNIITYKKFTKKEVKNFKKSIIKK